MGRDNRFSFTMTDTEAEHFDKVALAKGISKAEIIRQMIEHQYELISEDSELHQMVTELEKLAKQSEALMERFKASKANTEAPKGD